MYPFVMRNHDYPTKAFAHHKRISTDDIKSIIGRYALTLDCTVKTKIPAFPVKIGGRTCFPVGTFRTVLSTPEIEYALENDAIIECHQVVIYYKARIFESYVDYFYNQRLRYSEQGDKMNAEFSKKLLNTLYGKFGQTGNTWEKSDIPTRGYPGKWWVLDLDKMKRRQYMEIEGIVYESTNEPESRDSFPAIAAHVTAYGRILLQRTIDYIGSEQVLYSDTDSLLLTAHGYRKIRDKLHSSALGCWSLDGQYKSVEIRGPKDYTFGEKVKIKGIKRNATITREGLYRQLQFSSLRGSINRGELNHPTIKYIEKEMKRIYKKGVVQRSGRVKPFKLVDGELMS